jgi:hypothetical protein
LGADVEPPARRGYLFQNRFGSRVVRNDSDLLAVIAYVLRNPLEGGLVRNVADLARYPWSSYGALVGRRAPFPFECVPSTLAVFGDASEVARERLRAWILRQPVPETRPRSLDDLIREVCRDQAIAEADLRAGHRTRAASSARARICQRAIAELGLRPRDVASQLGLAESTVSQARKRPRFREDRGPSPS